MKKKDIRKQNLIQLGTIVLIIILANFISYTKLFHRFDLTAEKRYSLAPVSRNLLKDMDDIVFVKIYLEGDLNTGFRRMRNAIKELLEEFRVYSGDKLWYEFINPSENPDPEVRNNIFSELVDKGLLPSTIHEKDSEGRTSQKILFPGAIINFRNRELAVNLLRNNPEFSGEENLNNSIQTLEFQFINSFKKLSSEKIQKIAFIEGHGELDGYQVGDITDELAQYYEVYRGWIEPDTNSLDDYFAIIIAKPRYEFSEKEKYVIDQYIMNGGRVLWMIDAVNVNYDSLSTGSSTIAFIHSLNLEDQIFRYGVRINPSLVKDMQCALIPVNVALAGEQPNFVPAPWCYFPLLIPPDIHPITRNLNSIRSEFINVLDTVGGNPELKKTFLLYTSGYSKVVNAPLIISLEQINEQLIPEEFNQAFQPVAVLLEGKFESVFKNRSLAEYTKGDIKNYKEKSVNTKMIFVSDGDIIRNEVSFRGGRPVPMELGVDRYTRQTFGNKEFIMNAINYLSDDSDLMPLRSREIKLRLLDRAKIQEERHKWQIINTIVPVILVIIFGLLKAYLRKKKYTSG